MRDLARRALGALARRRWRHLPPRAGARAHGLPGPLVLSLTSYPARFGVLPLTLKTLLSQSVRPDRLVLWIAEGDAGRLPPAVLGLRRRGLEIRTCEDLRSFKKLVPAAEAFPGAWIATADDDQRYGRDWLARLAAAAGGPGDVVCHRARRIRLGEDGLPRPYRDWDWLTDAAEGDLVFPTGAGGILYPPALLGDPALVDRRFMELCPTGDDIWFWWRTRAAGARARKLGPPAAFRAWSPRTRESLAETNLEGGGNDRQIARMVEVFGFPPGAPR